MKRILPVLIILSGFLAASARATCSSTGASQTEDDRTALIPFGKVNLLDAYFAPAGTLLGSVTVPPTNYTYGGATASTVLWTCDQSDLSSLYFLAATNGDDRVGGFYEIGAADGLTGVYATYFAYVGLRLTMSGQVLARNWQKVPVTSYNLSGTKVQIRLQDIPPLQAELYRVSSLPGTSAASAYCGNSNNDGSGLVYGSTSGKDYSCIQPNAYIQLVGPGLTSDTEGQDSAYKWNFWGADNGFGYGMRAVNRLYNTPGCVVRSVTPLVTLPTITVAALNSGQSSSATFSVNVECSNSATSGTASQQTALGFQVSPGAWRAASSLGLINDTGGVSMLLSDDYLAGTTAQGAGIAIAYANTPSAPLTLLGQTGMDPLNTRYMGNSAGWYPVLSNATASGSTMTGYTHYAYNFVATLKKIDGQTVRPGKVKATATVVVKVQ